MRESLNEAQKHAVTQPPGTTLILAGAGSGKTHVIIQRITWLIENQLATPSMIFAVTFTNKAATEMRNRIIQQLNVPSLNGLWVGTFHGLAHRLLRLHWSAADLPEHFQIINSDDQLKLIKNQMEHLRLNKKLWPPQAIQIYINRQKEAGCRPDAVSVETQAQENMHAVYAKYDKVCHQQGLVDFTELLLRSYELWKKSPSLLEHYHKRFRFIFVDEFQDTNALQYLWLQCLKGTSGHLTVVGDDDQSIYSWRGACIEHIQSFTRDYPDATLIRLEQNYRSSKCILEAANRVIQHNTTRLGKQLWTQRNDGDKIKIFNAIDEIDEARFVTNALQHHYKKGIPYKNMAILYRSNAQSRVLEVQLLQSKVPYRIYGGVRFFERTEVKNVLAYLRLIYAPDDNVAFERVINLPPRGIGERTMEKIRQRSLEEHTSLWQTTLNTLKHNTLPKRTAQSFIDFIQLIEKWRACLTEIPLYQLVDQITKESQLIEMYTNKLDQKEQNRVEILEELVAAARTFNPYQQTLYDEDEHVPKTELEAFLTYTVLESGTSKHTTAIDDEHVQVMTLHLAKGLEFDIVFIVGLEEGLFPNEYALREGNLDEERRLCYVGITRAKQFLYLSYADSRNRYYDTVYNKPSRFLEELPETVIDHLSYKKHIIKRPITQFSTAPNAHTQFLKIGQLIVHPTFGKGSVLALFDHGVKSKVKIQFENRIYGTKLLQLQEAHLQII